MWSKARTGASRRGADDADTRRRYATQCPGDKALPRLPLRVLARMGGTPRSRLHGVDPREPCGAPGTDTGVPARLPATSSGAHQGGEAEGRAPVTAEQQAKLHAMLARLGAEDLAMQLAAVADVRDLDVENGLRQDVATRTGRLLHLIVVARR